MLCHDANASVNSSFTMTKHIMYYYKNEESMMTMSNKNKVNVNMDNFVF